MWYVLIACNTSNQIVIGMILNYTYITLANDQLEAQIFNIFIIILYMYMFRAISCSSSVSQTVLIQHLVSSLLVNKRPVHRCAQDGHLLRVTIPDAVLIQCDLLRMSKILLETCTCRGL
jgi:hypothetical protein